MDEIKSLMQNYEYITPKKAMGHGISKYRFYKFIHESELERISKGIYTAESILIDELYIINQRCPQAVFSHNEALYYHSLTDREPLIHTITIYSGYNAHRIRANLNCKVYYVKKELLEIGKVIVKDSFGNDIPMYNLERTICDLVRSRSTIEMQEFNSALKAYVRRKDKDLNLLMEYAKCFQIENIIRSYMEVLL